MTDTIESHCELMKYIKTHESVFLQPNYQFRVSEKLFEFYNSLIPDSDNESGHFINYTNEEKDANKWMEEAAVSLIWTSTNNVNPNLCERRLCINSSIN
jgi:hypothetical protein|tara:strand:+ start:150 stop:446 length:297 start_codon:yes stop_codon:yes gene_type:complete